MNEHIQKYASLYLIAIFILGFFLRLPGFFLRPLWVDEIVSYVIAYSSASVGQLIDIARSSVHPPLFLLFARWLSLAFGISINVMRAPSLLFGLLSPLLIYWASIKIFSSRIIGLISALITVFSILHIHYSIEARPYSILFVLGLILTVSLIKFLNQKKARYIWLLIFTIFLIVGIYIHYSVIIFGASCYILLLMIVASKKAREFFNVRKLSVQSIALVFLSGIFILISYIPWMGVIFREYLPWFQDLDIARTVAPIHPFFVFNWLSQLFWLSDSENTNNLLILSQTVGVLSLAIFFYEGLKRFVCLKTQGLKQGGNIAILIFLFLIFIVISIFSPISSAYTLITARHVMIVFPGLIIAMAWIFRNISFNKALAFVFIFILSMIAPFVLYYSSISRLPSVGFDVLTDNLALNNVDVDKVLIDGNALSRISYNFFAFQKNLPKAKLIHYLPDSEIESYYDPLMPTSTELLHEIYTPASHFEYSPIEFSAELKQLISDADKIYVIQESPSLKRRTLQWLCWNNWDVLDIKKFGQREVALFERCSDNCLDAIDRCIPLLP